MRCPNKECKGEVRHGVCDTCKKHCGCLFNATSMNDYCDYHRPKFKRERRLFSQADKDDAKDVLSALEIGRASCRERV